MAKNIKILMQKCTLYGYKDMAVLAALLYFNYYLELLASAEILQRQAKLKLLRLLVYLQTSPVEISMYVFC